MKLVTSSPDFGSYITAVLVPAAQHNVLFLGT